MTIARRLLVACAAITTLACGGEPSGPGTGALDVTVAGLPGGTNGILILQGPTGGNTLPSRTIAGSSLVPGLPAGSYTLTAHSASVGASRFDASPATQALSIQKSDTPLRVTVTYALATGGIAITVDGVPPGASTPLHVTGPQGYSQALTAGTTLEGLSPGTYTVAASDALFAGQRYAPTEKTQDVSVSATPAPTDATVHYVQTTGNLQLAISGVACGADGVVRITGPAGSQTVGQSAFLTGLLAGSYTVDADPVIVSGKSYQPQPVSQEIDVTPGGTAQAAVAYLGSAGAGPNFAIDGAYVVQIVQTPASTVPLVAGKAGLLRVTVASAESATPAPLVRARFYQNGALVDTRTLPPPTGTVQCPDEGVLATTWNTKLDASLITTGLSVLLDVDPDQAIAESDETDNDWPANGQPHALDVRATPPLVVRFVPVTQSSTGLTGAINVSNATNFIAFARKLFPIEVIDVTVRPPFTTSTPALQSDDDNHAWTTILNELAALRVADGAFQNYYGVVKVNYQSGVAGYGFVPGVAAIGWDYLPSGQLIAAHELGHNLGRSHAPCGGAAGADPAYPYAGGTIGVYGWDPQFNVLRPPSTSDLMGYCGFQWISDYNYVGILEGRGIGPTIAAAARLPRPSLIVWGRSENGRLVLEPSFSAVTSPSLPTESGRFRIEGLDAGGRVLFSHAFAGSRPADDDDPDARHFAFAIPLDPGEQASLATIRYSDGARSVVRRAAPTRAVADAAVDVREVRRGGTVARLQWAATAPMAVVRDAGTGEIIAFARDGDATVTATAGRELVVQLTDGVRSGAARRLRVERRQ